MKNPFRKKRERSSTREVLAPELDEFDRQTVELARPHTMTSDQRLQALILATRHVVRRRLAGCFVECGVWRGGSMFAAARTLLHIEGAQRNLYLYDTYSGMSAPTAEDVRFHDGVSAAEFLLDKSEKHAHCIAGLQVVKDTMALSGYNAGMLHFIQGKVEDTIPAIIPKQIALLRLDTDWYSSTRHELQHLYPRLIRGGVLILDDYGWWDGARRAVDEFFADHDEPPLLNVIDASGRMAIKG